VEGAVRHRGAAAAAASAARGLKIPPQRRRLRRRGGATATATAARRALAVPGVGCPVVLLVPHCQPEWQPGGLPPQAVA
jgi:hypothetical protein